MPLNVIDKIFNVHDMKKIVQLTLLLITISLISVDLIAQETTDLRVDNLIVIFREGREMPDGMKDENSLDISFAIKNVKKANRAKVVVKDSNTEEILDVKTIKFNERDGVTFYSSQGYPRRIKRGIIPVQVNIGSLTQHQASVEVFAIDKNNKATEKIKQ